MKRIVFVLLATSLMSSAFAQHSQLQTEHSLKHKIGVDTPILPADENQFLFFQLPSSLQRSSAHKIEFILHQKAVIYLVERLMLDPSDEDVSSSIQFLSREPARLRELLRLIKKDNYHLSLAVRLDGQMVQEFSFDEFLTYSRNLKHEPGFHPVQANPRVMVLKWPKGKEKGASTIQAQDLTCTQECDIAYEDCAQQACGDPMSICGECLDQWEACRDACPPPPPPPCSPTTTHTTQTYQLSCNLIFGPVCMPGLYGGFTKQYYVTCNYVTYTTYHTVYCDGSASDTVYADYFSQSGYLDSGESC